MKNIFMLMVSFSIILFTLIPTTVGHTNPDPVGSLTHDEILQSKAAFVVVDEEIARHLNLSELSEWDYQKLRGPVLLKIRTAIHFQLRDQFGRIVHTVDFGAQLDFGSSSQTPSMNRGNKLILYKKASEIIRDFIDQEHISVIIMSDAPVGLGETAAIRRLRGEMRYIYELINGASVSIPIKNLTSLIKLRFVREIWPNSKGKLTLFQSVPQIGADKVHDTPPRGFGITGMGVRVAVVDTGIDRTHSEFKDSNGKSRIVADRRWRLTFQLAKRDHGTHVAGIIGAAADGNIVTGVAPNVHLLDAETQNPFFYKDTSYGDAMDAIEWAVDNNADVINMSLGWDPWKYDSDGKQYGWAGGDPMSQLIDRVVDSGVVFVVSAGNEARRRASGNIASNSKPMFHEFYVDEAGDVEVVLLWDTLVNDLDLVILDSSKTQELYSSRADTSVFESVKFKSQNANIGYTIRVEAPFGIGSGNQPYEVWVSDGSLFHQHDFDPTQTVGVPGYSEKAITVGAVDPNNDSAWYSSQGPSSPVAVNPNLVLNPSFIKPEIVAPGGQAIGKNTGIYSTEASPLGHEYGKRSGTSMAAPHVAGVAALILDAVGKNDRGEWNFSPDEVKSAIVRGAEGGVGSLPNMPDNIYGAGLVRADNIIFSDTVPAYGKLRFKIIPRLYRSNYGGYRLNADPYLVAAISWENPAHNLDLVLSDASNGRTLPMLSQTASNSAKIGGNEFILPDPGATYFLDVINRSQAAVPFTGAATHKIEFFSIPEQTPPSTIPTRNQPPVTVNTITAQTLAVGDSPKKVNVSNYFQDPEGKNLTYTAESTDTSVAVADVPRFTSQITITPRGEGIATVIVTAEDPGGLTATQTIAVRVQQAADSCTYTLSKHSQDVPAAGGSLWINLTTHANCSWTARSNDGFLSLTPRSGTGNGTVEVMVNANTSDRLRTGTLTIAGRAFTVEQAGQLTLAAQDLSIGDGVVVQNAGTVGLNIRSTTQVADWTQLGKTYDGATGIIRQGPRTAGGFTWWKVEWDRSAKVVWNGGFAPLDNQAWSVEATDHGVHLARRPPDLEVRSFDVSDSTLTPGEELTLTAEIRNNGPGNSPATEIHFYHSSTGTFSADDDVSLAGTAQLPALSKHQSRTLRISVKVPLTPDRYYYGVFIEQDTRNETDIDNLQNNYADEERVTVTSSPDLVIESISVRGELTLEPRETFRINATVRNEGIGEANGTTLRYYRSSDATISDSDTEVETDGVGALDATAKSDESETLTAPSKPGIYYYGVCVDSVRDESDTSNNCSTVVAITVQAPTTPVQTPDPPDLIVESLRVSDNDLVPGQSFTLYATIRNQKTGTSSSTRLRYYRSSDATISGSDAEVGTDSVSALNADGTETGNISLTAPLAAGTYYYGVCVDSVTGESDTNNNCSQSVTITVQQPAGTSVSMYWTDWDTNKIQRANLDGSNVQDLVTTGLGSPYGIALDVAAGKMYWADAGLAKIQRANLNGSNVQNLIPLGLSVPICIALDVAGGKMYWTDRGTGKIQRANLDGSNVEDLVFGVRGLHGIALDVGGGKMYWTDNDAGKIQRANLNGTSLEDLITTGLQLPNEIALDVTGGKMYWADDGTQKIQRANLNGTGVQDLVTTGLNVPVGITLDIVSGKMYWTDLGTRKIQRANLDGANVEDLVTTGLNAPFGIALGTSLTISPLVVAREDVNSDGVVDAQDVVLVDQNNLDLNDDGVSDIADILLVVEAMGNAGGAPAARLQAQHLLTAERVQLWLVEAKLLDEDSPAYRRGILVLEQLLALLAPRETVLLPNYPNPFNPETWIPYQIAEPADVTVHIYATTGHLVRTLRLGHQQAGIYHNRNRAAYWDGRNELGEPIASGLYFYTLSAGHFTATRKMLIRK